MRQDWAHEMLFELSASRDTQVACRAIRAIGQGGMPQAGEHLLALLGSVEDEQLETQCYLALGELRYRSALDVLAGAARASGFFGLFRPKERIVRAAAVWAITHIDGEPAAGILERLTRDRDQVIAHEAQMGLAWRAGAAAQNVWAVAT